MPDNRFQQLVNAGFCASVGDISPGAKQVISALENVEFEAILSMHDKVFEAAGLEARQEYERFVCIIF